MPGNLENSSMITGQEEVNFTLIPKRSNVNKCSNYCTIMLISYAGKVTLKIPQSRFQQPVNWELSNVQIGLGKAEEPEMKLPIFFGSYKKQWIPENDLLLFHSLWYSLCLCGFLKLWTILKEMCILDHITWLLWNLYAGQEVTESGRNNGRVQNW